MHAQPAASFTDTHAHLALPEFAADLPQVLGRARAAGVSRIVVVALDPPSARRSMALAEQHAGLYATAGLHPHAADRWSAGLERELEALCQHPAVVAVGETGLDRVRGAPWEDQVTAFEAQLALAARVGKPVVIHNREAGPEILACLDRTPAVPRGVMHCFTGDLALAEACLARGFYLAFGGVVTYRSGAGLREVVAAVLPERLLLETDCPYLAPMPQRGQRNEPAHIRFTATQVAMWRGTDETHVASATTANALRLFGLS
jgi:TatD DNase family protein